jgi:NADH:ubiquinone oxidoreductase subunit 4 (subunit M)
MSALIVATIWLGIYPWPILEALKPARENAAAVDAALWAAQR